MLVFPGSGARLPAVAGVVVKAFGMLGAFGTLGTIGLLGALGLVGVLTASSATPTPVPDGLVDQRDRTAATRAAEPWVWPTGTRVVERGWEPPSDDYAAGHRGIDVPAPIGTLADAVDDGTVAFAGSVGGRSVVTIDHGGGLVSTLDSVQPLVAAGDDVRQGDPVGRVSVGHCPATAPCLHLGARVDGRYVDPMPYLPPAEWPVLLPESAWPG